MVWYGMAAATHGEDQRDAASHGLAPVELGGVREPHALVAGAALPADDGRAEQQDIDALARGQHGAHAAVVVGDVGLGLRGQARGRQCGGLVGTVNHLSGLRQAGRSAAAGVCRWAVVAWRRYGVRYLCSRRALGRSTVSMEQLLVCGDGDDDGGDDEDGGVVLGRCHCG